MESIPKSLQASPKANILMEATALSKRLHGREVLQKVDFSISRNEIVTLIGPNGCGKTTLLRCLLGLIKADSGRIRRRRGLRVGYVPQKVHFEPNFPMTVRYFLKISTKTPVNPAQVVEMTRIEPLLSRQMRELSGGELQRVLLAQALLSKPELLVLDEPVQGVDFGGQAELYRMIRNISRERDCAVVMVSHDLHLVMADTDRVLCLNGHICCSGTPQGVSKDPAFVKLFGEDVARQIAFYVHHHDHQHSIDGTIKHGEEGHSCSTH